MTMKKLEANPIYPEVTSFWNFPGKHDFIHKWFLLESPYPIMGIAGIYLLFVLKLGPEFMKHRKPFQLKTVLVVYNALQVAISMIMVSLAIDLFYEIGPFPDSCVPDDKDLLYRLMTTGYYYFLCKLTELLDTVLFVLRKKQNQVTFLHVYHHTMMFVSSWFYGKYDPGAWMLVLGLINCFVHVLMYGYYGLSTFPSLRKYLWWKKYITSLQLIQFFTVLIQVTISLFICECKPGYGTILFFYTNLILFIYLFSTFYVKSYNKNDKQNALINNTSTEDLSTNGFHSHKNGLQNGSVLISDSTIRQRIN